MLETKGVKVARNSKYDVFSFNAVFDRYPSKLLGRFVFEYNLVQLQQREQFNHALCPDDT